MPLVGLTDLSFNLPLSWTYPVGCSNSRISGFWTDPDIRPMDHCTVSIRDLRVKLWARQIKLHQDLYVLVLGMAGICHITTVFAKKYKTYPDWIVLLNNPRTPAASDIRSDWLITNGVCLPTWKSIHYTWHCTSPMMGITLIWQTSYSPYQASAYLPTVFLLPLISIFYLTRIPHGKSRQRVGKCPKWTSWWR